NPQPTEWETLVPAMRKLWANETTLSPIPFKEWVRLLQSIDVNNKEELAAMPSVKVKEFYEEMQRNADIKRKRQTYETGNGMAASKTMKELQPIDERLMEPGAITVSLIEASRYGPTILPLLFAATLGRALKAILFWRLERGERVGTLDVLAGSTTLVNTLGTQLSLRTASLIGVILLPLWALSPIGGQASLRVMATGHKVSNESLNLHYLAVNSSFEGFLIADGPSETAVVNGIFMASLLSPWSAKQSSVDIWGNIKVPMIEALQGQTAAEGDGWLDVPTENVTYASLVGLPVSTLPQSDNSIFNLETSYWIFDCSVLQSDFIDISAPGWQNVSGPASYLASNTSVDLNARALRSSGTDPSVSSRFIVHNTWDPGYGRSGAICTINTSYVEPQVFCVGKSCKTIKMRPSTMPHKPNAWTALDANYGDNFRYFGIYFVKAIAGQSATPTAVQTYFVNPQSPFSTQNQSLSSVGSESYATSLAQLMNTFWQACMGFYVIPIGMSPQLANYATLCNDTDVACMYGWDPNGNVVTAQALNATGQVFHSIEVIVCRKSWLCVLLIATIVMVAAGITRLLLRFTCRMPDLAMALLLGVRHFEPLNGLAC
ncbi:hypothetical protein B0A49_08043, partial [Cryomyces minteri]